jgi:rusticyanin
VDDPTRDVDARYARGEIPRDEWLRMRESAKAGTPTASPPPPPPPPKANLGRSLLVAAVVIVAGIVVASAFLLTMSPSGTNAMNPSYGTARQLSASDLAALNTSATSGMAFESNHTLWFPHGSVNLVVYASPPIHDMDFVIQGMVNPTIHVAAGSRITVTVVNMDGDMYHNWGLTQQGPPYDSMPMMGSGMSMMMTMSMLGPASSSGLWSQSLTFNAAAGSYWYLCTVTGHASQGMYGSFIVG